MAQLEPLSSQMSSRQTTEHEKQSDPGVLIRRLSTLRWLLPLLIFLFVVAHQMLKLGTVDQWSVLGRFVAGVAVYGLIGPTVTYFTLNWITGQIHEKEKAEAQIRRLNRELEQRVAERTDELAQAYDELTQRNEALETANEELKELDQLKSDFVSMVSHELRAPLTNINGSIEIMLNDNDMTPETQRTMLQIIGEQTGRLTRLVQGILNISRIEARTLALRPEAVNVHALIERVVKNLNRSDNIHDFRTPEQSSLPVWADPDRLEEILTNLIDNAIKYTPEGGIIEISSGIDRNQFIISVHDQGMGIPSKELDKIFQKFHRVDRRDARATYGHGLGLYISKLLVEVQGGRIWAESELGKGSTFRFSLPTADTALSESVLTQTNLKNGA